MQLMESLPLRECGLKCDCNLESLQKKLSLPLRECGLKSWSYHVISLSHVSLPLRECGLKLMTTIGIIMVLFSHSPCGSVD